MAARLRRLEEEYVREPGWMKRKTQTGVSEVHGRRVRARTRSILEEFAATVRNGTAGLDGFSRSRRG